MVFDYATSNAKANAVRAFGGLVGCLARVKPEKTLDKFLPYCFQQIVTELQHGASSIRTTSTHGAVPSDTTLHWCKPFSLCISRKSEGIIIKSYLNSSWVHGLRWSCCESLPVMLFLFIDSLFPKQLLRRKDEVMKLLSLLINGTLSERGYTSTGKLITRILSTLSGVYPVNSRFVNSDEWNDPGNHF